MTPLVLIHGFTGSPDVWELVKPRLASRHALLTPALPGHLGGPPLPATITDTTMVESVERAMDDAGYETAHVVGNSLGGYVALQLAARGRARTVTAFAPAGGWDDAAEQRATLALNAESHALTRGAERNAAFIASSAQGRKQALAFMAEHTDHVPAELVVQVIRAGALCTEAPRMIAFAAQSAWPLETPKCPTRIVWGTSDKLLPWPAAAARYRRDLAYAEWIELDGVGHCPQVDVPTIAAELILGAT
ncbi:alpha/beta fold hydrolase [Solirubrobacter phytolaccae]|uniref:Alpha/beta fold hydrolase n=1 Tax=Solirubrobacter phytolaccae TaxID=1404360 RepID=A0A9X3NB62_9ACTN|nr:alpha/beta fold hydrolase [Solirubrobacter phytolaccae]MDA0179472.1 alpha/beta fold hydrolase [Solirubrobacter phytolaccae]